MLVSWSTLDRKKGEPVVGVYKRVLEAVTIEEMESCFPLKEDDRNWAYEIWLRRMREARSDDVDGWLESMKRAATSSTVRSGCIQRLDFLRPVAGEEVVKEEEKRDNGWIESPVLPLLFLLVVAVAMLIGVVAEIGRIMGR